MTADALLFQRPNDQLDHPFPLKAVGRDELLLQSIAPDQASVVATCKNQTVVGPEDEGILNPAQASVTGNQGPLEGGTGGRGLPGLESCQPSSSRVWQSITKPRSTSRPAHPRHGIGRWPSADPGLSQQTSRHLSRSMANGPLPDLPALELEDPLNCVLVEDEQVGHRPIAGTRVPPRSVPWWARRRLD